MKFAVYTCITNNYNALKVPKVVNSSVDYYCFHDGSISVLEPWISLKLNHNVSAKDLNRLIKIQPHLNEVLKTYDLTIYVDGSIEILSDLSELICMVMKSDGHTFMYNHNLRNCVYDECMECYLSGKISLRAFTRMRFYLETERMVKNFGLFEAGIILRKSRTLDSISLNNYWWANYENSFEVKRDQISLVYTLWRHGMTIMELGVPDFYLTHNHFRIYHHRHSLLIQRLVSWYILRPLRSALLKMVIRVRFDQK